MSERLTADISHDLRASAQDMRAEHRNTDAGPLTEAADKLDGLIALLAEAEAKLRGEVSGEKCGGDGCPGCPGCWARAALTDAEPQHPAEVERDEWKHRATELQPAAIHERESLRSENTRLRDLVRRYEGTDNDSTLTYAELEQERDRLARELYEAQDCGHDLEAFARQAVAMVRTRAVRDMLAQPGGTVAEPVIVELLDGALGDAPGPSGMDPAEFTALERLTGGAARREHLLAQVKAGRLNWLNKAKDFEEMYHRARDERNRLADTVRRYEPS